MSFEIPSLKELSERTRLAFRAELPGTDAHVWPSFLYVCSKVIAAMVWAPFKRLQWVIQQAFVTTSEGEWLERHGLDVGITRKAASHAEGSLIINAITMTEVPYGDIFIDENGITFEAQSGINLNAGTIGSISVRAIQPGVSGNVPANTAMASSNGTGEFSSVVGALGIIGGANAEDDEGLRSRILFRLRNPPHCGTASDYVRWATEVAGVTRADVEPLINGPGTVGVYIVMDGSYPYGIPPQGALDKVKEYLDDVAPIGAKKYVLAPEPVIIDIVINQMTPYTAQVQDSVKADIGDLFFSKAFVSTNKKPLVFSQSWIWQAVANATGETSHLLVQPQEDIICTPGQLPVLGTVSINN